MTVNDSDRPTQSTADEVKAILVQNLGVNEGALATVGQSLEDIGLDSLAVMELQAIVKQRYGVVLPEDLLEMQVDEITDLVAGNRDGGN